MHKKLKLNEIVKGIKLNVWHDNIKIKQIQKAMYMYIEFKTADNTVKLISINKMTRLQQFVPNIFND